MEGDESSQCTRKTCSTPQFDAVAKHPLGQLTHCSRSRGTTGCSRA